MNATTQGNDVFGYADPLATRAGDTVSFMLSAQRPTTAQIQLVRLLHGDDNPRGPGFVETEVACALPREVAVVHQPTRPGSYARVPADVALTDRSCGTLYAFVYPTAPGAREQTIAACWSSATQDGYALSIDAGACLRFRAGGAGQLSEVVLDKPLVPHTWYFVAARWDRDAKRMSLLQSARLNRWNSRLGPVAPFDYGDARTDEDSFTVGAARGIDFTLAAVLDVTGAPVDRYNGKIDRPGLHGRWLDDAELDAIGQGATPSSDGIVAHWDTTAGYTEHGIGDRIIDVGPSQRHAMGINRPVRAMTGWNWKGREDSFRLDPSQYGGITFHDDALIDCGWQATVSFDIPKDLRSGVYALRVRADGKEDHVPFFVRAAAPRSKIALLLPTFSYLAYANEHLAFDGAIAQAICANAPIVGPQDLHWNASAEFGLSTYDVHSDYAGVCYSSWRRPIFNLRPRYRMPSVGVPWQFPADLSLLWWLEQTQQHYEILTDHDLDREGVSALQPYKVVLTGTHPEYTSERMLDGIEDYLSSGGRFCYLGGNGFYWVTATRNDEPWCIEVRKLDSGSRAWQAAPGEHYLATTGERSGLWRARGRAPQKIVGVGFTTEGMDESQPFRRLPDAQHPDARWIFKGLTDNEPIGDFGLGLGGASGLEMDRYDLALGTPPHAMLLAASFGHSDNYPLVSEDIGYAFPGRGGTQDPQVRGDIVYYTTPGGGAVFSAGSIAWSQALPCNSGDNNVARIMTNVLAAFCSDAPLPRSE